MRIDPFSSSRYSRRGFLWEKGVGRKGRTKCFQIFFLSLFHPTAGQGLYPPCIQVLTQLHPPFLRHIGRHSMSSTLTAASILRDPRCWNFVFNTLFSSTRDTMGNKYAHHLYQFHEWIKHYSIQCYYYYTVRIFSSLPPVLMEAGRVTKHASASSSIQRNLWRFRRKQTGTDNMIHKKGEASICASRKTFVKHIIYLQLMEPLS